MTEKRIGGRAMSLAADSLFHPASGFRMITAAPAQERFTQHPAIHLVERLRFDDRDADTFISTEQRLGTYDESAAALLAGRVE